MPLWKFRSLADAEVSSALTSTWTRSVSVRPARRGKRSRSSGPPESPPRVAVALDVMAAHALIEWRRAGRFTAPVVGVDLALEPAAWARQAFSA